MQPFHKEKRIKSERGGQAPVIKPCMEEKRQLTEKYFDMVYRLAFSQIKNSEQADDVVQEVFLRFIKNNKPFDTEEHIKAWLLRVTLNCCKNVFSSSWYKKTVPLSERKEGIHFDNIEKSEVYYAVSELPSKYRAVIHLFYYEDMSVEEISKHLGINPSTIKSQLSRGRQILSKKLKGRYDIV